MRNVVGIKLKNTGESSYYDPKDEVFCVGDRVIVEGPLGCDLGTISIPAMEIDEERFEILDTIVRRATQEDLEQEMLNQADEKEAYQICKEKIAEHDLPMKLICAEYSFERNKLLFYFTADGRVDFRELVKDLAAIFHTRIELRQVGVRDETKFLGGIGICGREFCCQTFLTEFAPVSIKMAKEQKLSLNPTKISGVCGRLMCCLKNEEETYEYLNRQLPTRGESVKTVGGREGVVYSVNALKQRVNVLFEENDEREVQEYSIEEIIRSEIKYIPEEDDELEEDVIEEAELEEDTEEIEDEDKTQGFNKRRNRRRYRRPHRPDKDHE